MGTYTHFIFDATLKKDGPKPLLDYIKFRLTNSNELCDNEPFDDHPFFKCQRWHWILTWHNCDDNGFKSHCEETDNGLHIYIDTRLKNYCASIEWFLILVAPLVDLDFECMMMREVEDYHSLVQEEDAKDIIRRIQQQVELHVEPIKELKSRF